MAKSKKGIGTSPSAAKKQAAAKGEKIVKPGKTNKAKEPKPKKTKDPMPRGFGSQESSNRVVEAISVLRKKFPKLDESSARRYLTEVGAGRFLALHTYGEKK